MIVKIERYFSYPDIKRQTPECTFKWKSIVFTEENVKECDYLVILEYPKNDVYIKVPKKNIIHICQEPPNEVSKYRQFANRQVAYNINQYKKSKKMILSHGALPWHINKDYDFLNKLKIEELNKKNIVTWVTSNQRGSKGHQERMSFFNKIKDLSFVDLYGRGIRPIDDKWDVLASSKYAIAYENYQSDTYWTEKIMDCFLSYTMPFYFGCKNINQFFPKDSFIQLDPKDKHIKLFLKEVIRSKKFEKNIEAISEARNLVLNKYQLFPFLYDFIQSLEQNKTNKLATKEEVFIKGGDAYFDNYPLILKVEKNMHKLKRKITNKFYK